MFSSQDEIKTFIFFAKNSTSKEAIHATEAYIWSEAVRTFAQLKNLPLKEFLEVYDVARKQS